MLKWSSAFCSLQTFPSWTALGDTAQSEKAGVLDSASVPTCASAASSLVSRVVCTDAVAVRVCCCRIRTLFSVKNPARIVGDFGAAVGWCALVGCLVGFRRGMGSLGGKGQERFISCDPLGARWSGFLYL